MIPSENGLIEASKLLKEIDPKFNPKKGPGNTLRRLNDLQIPVANQRVYGAGIQFLVKIEDAEKARSKLTKQTEVCEKKKSLDETDHRVMVIEHYVQTIANGLFAVAAELGIVLCANCGASRDKDHTVACPECGSWSE